MKVAHKVARSYLDIGPLSAQSGSPELWRRPLRVPLWSEDIEAREAALERIDVLKNVIAMESVAFTESADEEFIAQKIVEHQKILERVAKQHGQPHGQTKILSPAAAVGIALYEKRRLATYNYERLIYPIGQRPEAIIIGPPEALEANPADA